MISFFIKTFFLILFLDLVYFKIYRMSAGPQQQTNEWCRISQLQTWISTIKLVKRYETANRPLRQGDEELKKRIKQKNIYISFSPWRRFVFKPNYWAVCLNMYIFFVLFFCLLLHRLAVRISLPFHIFLLPYFTLHCTSRAKGEISRTRIPLARPIKR